MIGGRHRGNLQKKRVYHMMSHLGVILESNVLKLINHKWFTYLARLRNDAHNIVAYTIKCWPKQSPILIFLQMLCEF